MEPGKNFNRLFLFQSRICLLIFFALSFTFFLSSCEQTPGDEQGTSFASGVHLSSKTAATWNVESSRLVVSGKVSRDEDRVEVFDVKINGQRTSLGSVGVKSDGSWRLNLSFSNSAYVPCIIFAKSDRLNDKVSVSGAPSNCGQSIASLAGQPPNQSTAIIYNGKITTPLSNIEIFTGEAITFNASVSIDAINNQAESDSDGKSRDSRENSDNIIREVDRKRKDNQIDIDSLALLYTWDFGSYAPAVQGASTTVTFNMAGTVTVKLLVRDDAGNIDPTPDTVVINVFDTVVNSEPDGIINTPEANKVVSVGDSIFFSGSGFDPDGGALSYYWDFGDSGIAASTQQNPGNKIFNKAGTYVVSFIVTDNSNLIDLTPARISVTVVAANLPPDGSIRKPDGDKSINVGDSLFFDARASDPEGDDINYLWDFGASGLGRSMSKSPGTLVFNQAGIFNVTLTTTDIKNASDLTPDTITITVASGNVVNTPVKLPLDPGTQAQFVNPLTIPATLQPVIVNGYETYTVAMTEFQQDLGLKDPMSGLPLMTTVWGYGGTYPGPTIEARSTSPVNISAPGLPTKVLWLNQLPEKHLLPIDPTVGCGINAPDCKPEVRTVTHLHGGHVDSDSDGLPEAWFSPGFEKTGIKFKASMNGVYTYRNDQEAANLWYHDHAIGATRLNVYAGLAGFYLLHDVNEDRLYAQRNIPDNKYTIPLLIQDKSFYEDGSLRYDRGEPITFDPVTGDANPSVVPEFYGDTILVNGKTWPKLEVEPRIYRFRILNGSNSRFFNLRLTAGFQDLPFHIIGSDGGFLNNTVQRSSVLMAPAERLDILVDFSNPVFAGRYIMLTNDANSPFPDGDPVATGITDRVMLFHVTKPLDATIRRTSIPDGLRTSNIPSLTPTVGVAERELLLSEEVDDYGRLLPQLGTSAGGSMLWSDPVTEKPVLGTTEVWKIINNTGDAHPVHKHLVQFRILERQAFDTASYIPGEPSTLTLIGAPMLPNPEEAGWKDTVKAAPGEVVRIIANYDLPGEYVWHCHILEHEDHEMMRPFIVVN